MALPRSSSEVKPSIFAAAGLIKLNLPSRSMPKMPSPDGGQDELALAANEIELVLCFLLLGDVHCRG